MTARRRVRIWRTECQRWAWCCTFCQPPAHGLTETWDRTIANTRRHFRRRTQHHAWVSKAMP